jgi:hypothetical protein
MNHLKSLPAQRLARDISATLCRLNDRLKEVKDPEDRAILEDHFNCLDYLSFKLSGDYYIAAQEAEGPEDIQENIEDIVAYVRTFDE